MINVVPDNFKSFSVNATEESLEATNPRGSHRCE